MGTVRTGNVRAQMVAATVVFLFSTITVAYDAPGPGEPDVISDIVFVIDGSGSVNNGGWPDQIEGIVECFQGENAFIPHDGTVAIGVIQFDSQAYAEVALQIIDSSTKADALEADIRGIVQRGG